MNYGLLSVCCAGECISLACQTLWAATAAVELESSTFLCVIFFLTVELLRRKLKSSLHCYDDDPSPLYLPWTLEKYKKVF